MCTCHLSPATLHGVLYSQLQNLIRRKEKAQRELVLEEGNMFTPWSGDLQRVDPHATGPLVLEAERLAADLSAAQSARERKGKWSERETMNGATARAR